MDSQGGYLTAEEVNLVHNQSRIGVILSEQEGGCGASTEYLLAGLPVVSTSSTGGRDLFYDSGNSIICEPTVDGVRSALNQTLAMEWSP
ncbi:glycosyltransferase [Planctomicrobium piriforme]|uniref:glycosyltransferase n=1 Tax=Planctomicrobium piriforme TaxID=1576369 RepID=UPI000B88A39B|nr:glycosyltransferase [Planctomicrobium piriforme]